MLTRRATPREKQRLGKKTKTGSIRSTITGVRISNLSNLLKRARKSRSGSRFWKTRVSAIYPRILASTLILHAHIMSSRNAILRTWTVTVCRWLGRATSCGTVRSSCVGIWQNRFMPTSRRARMLKLNSPIRLWTKICIPIVTQPGKTLFGIASSNLDVRFPISRISICRGNCLWTSSPCLTGLQPMWHTMLLTTGYAEQSCRMALRWGIR